MDKMTVIGVLAGIIIGFVLAKLTGGKRDKPHAATREVIDRKNMDSDVIALLESGRKVQAIKRYREVYNVDLKEAKEAVDSLEDHR